MNARNDHKGRVEHDSTLSLVTFYASGTRGHEVRADGNGKTLARGYYGRTELTGTLGPFSCRKVAFRETYFGRHDVRQGLPIGTLLHGDEKTS